MEEGAGDFSFLFEPSIVGNEKEVLLKRLGKFSALCISDSALRILHSPVT